MVGSFSRHLQVQTSKTLLMLQNDSFQSHAYIMPTESRHLTNLWSRTDNAHLYLPTTILPEFDDLALHLYYNSWW